MADKKKDNNVIAWEDYKKASAEKQSGKVKGKGKPQKSLWDDDLKDLESGTYGSRYAKNSAPLAPATTVYAPRCAESHKPLPITVDGVEYFIYGGSCSNPIVHDADIYVGFERGMKESTKIYPWHEGASFYFPIQDGNVPLSLDEAKNLIKYLSDSLKAGKKVHIGCIGGHGRTGTILAALVTYMTGNKASIEYVRKQYCKKAVESTTQVEWLNKHFKVDKAEPSKPSYVGHTDSMYGAYGKGSGVSKYPNYSDQANRAQSNLTVDGFTKFETVKPVKVKGNVWGF